MSLNVEKALQMDVFSRCKALTGSAGLANEIRWVNILEILDDLSHIEPGEFLITTAYGYDISDAVKQQRLMELFADNRLAALAIQTGHYIKEIPPSLIKLAASFEIPVIEIPPEISFKSLTKALLGELVRGDPAGQNGDLIMQKGGLQRLARQHDTLIRKLLSGEKPENLRAELKALHISSHADFYLMLAGARPEIEAAESAPARPETTTAWQIKQTLIKLLVQYNLPFLAGIQGQNLVILVQPLAPQAKQFTLLARQLLQELALLFPSLTFSFGISSRRRHLNEIAPALDEAEKSLEAAEMKLMGNHNLLGYEQLGPYQLLLEIKNLEVLKATFRKTVEPLLDYDRRSGGALVSTLRVYLKHMNISTTAEELFVHRHTLRYRLNQIEKLTGIKLINNPAGSFQLYLGLMVYDYLKAYGLL